MNHLLKLHVALLAHKYDIQFNHYLGEI